MFGLNYSSKLQEKGCGFWGVGSELYFGILLL